MDILNIFFFIVFSLIAVSYGWGMRGTIIGGEKGAMLPGALMGFLMAVFSESEVLASSPWILAGVGALGMYCGGNMTYGETLHLSMHEKNSPHLKKGLIALFVKGGIWFGLFGGFVSLFISALAGFYELWQILVFFGALPIFALAFFFIFNKPLNPDENKFPKIYFSIKRQESWGGLFGILIEIVIFSIVFKDWSALAMTGGAFLSGAVGWVIAQFMQIKARHHGKNGKRLFEKLNQKNAVEAWKLMECVLGAIGGLGTAATFLLSKPLFAEKFTLIDANGFHSFISEKVTYLLFILYGVILLVDSLQYFLYPTKNKKYNKKLLKMKLITKDAYENAIDINPEDSKVYVLYKKFCEKSEFAIYCIIPLLFCMIGSHMVAAAVAFPVVMLVLCQEVAEKCFKMGKGNYFWKIMYFLPAVAVFILIATSKKAMETSITMLMYTLFYEMVFFILKLLENDDIRLSAGEKTVHGYFITCCTAINILTFFI